MDDKKKIW